MPAYPRAVDRDSPPGRGRPTNGSPSDPHAAARAAMVEWQLRARGVRDERVLAAMATVPRERFVRPGDQDLAYADEALPIDAGQTISQPLMVALTLELLAPEPDQRVLDIGTGSGYQAAVLAAMGCQVLSIERVATLADAAQERLNALGYGQRVEVRTGDGSLGDPDGAPWPRIVVGAAAPRVPEPLAAQLAEGGRLVVPVGERWHQELTLVVREGGRLRTSQHGGCVFVPLIGAAGHHRG